MRACVCDRDTIRTYGKMRYVCRDDVGVELKFRFIAAGQSVTGTELERSGSRKPGVGRGADRGCTYVGKLKCRVWNVENVECEE